MIANPHAVLRLARRECLVAIAREPAHLIEDPAPMRADELAADAVLSLENRRRYMAQSSATVAGLAAPVPQRQPMLPIVSPIHHKED